jgi:DNA-directed RNA polymerase subunit beta'
MKGLVSNPKGEIIEFPIRNSFKEGLSIVEYFISTHGARKGIADKALATPLAGYLSRRLVDAIHGVIIREFDCQTKNYLVFLKEQALGNRESFKEQIFGRTAAEDIKINKKIIVKKGNFITNKIATILDKNKEIKAVKVRSPLCCDTLHGICQLCYGMDLARNSLIEIGEAVGVIAAQSIGEPGTQLTMRTFHKGGIVEKQTDIVQGLPRVQELFEVRTPMSKACLSQVNGSIKSIHTQDNHWVITINNNEYDPIKVNKAAWKKRQLGQEVVYSIPKTKEIFVAEKDLISKGQPIFEGAIDPKELFVLAGEEKTREYIIKSLIEVYTSQGVSINRKHFEIVIKQMFSRVQINDSGDTDLVIKEIIERDIVIEKNKKIKEQGGKEATYETVILGITQIALTTSSFLSAASFQETSRVLAKAAVMGKVDKLRGLKESIIIGKLIPAGTGFKTNK